MEEAGGSEGGQVGAEGERREGVEERQCVWKGESRQEGGRGKDMLF